MVGRKLTVKTGERRAGKEVLGGSNVWAHGTERSGPIAVGTSRPALADLSV